MRSTSESAYLSIETFMEEINPVVTQKFEFEQRDKSKLIIVFLQFSDYKDSAAKPTVNDFAIKISTNIVKFPLETLVGERY